MYYFLLTLKKDIIKVKLEKKIKEYKFKKLGRKITFQENYSIMTNNRN